MARSDAPLRAALTDHRHYDVDDDDDVHQKVSDLKSEQIFLPPLVARRRVRRGLSGHARGDMLRADKMEGTWCPDF